jgi:hypothetical protein
MRDLSIALKTMRATLHLREFSYQDPDVVHNEGQVLGFRPASQGDGWPMAPDRAKSVYLNAYTQVLRAYELSDPLLSGLSEMDSQTISNQRYRANTAFIMMWMDDARPELDDIRDTVQDVFAAFGVKAIRADDIEHSDVITKRIIDEITTSEFLFADLTGARPSVYYEVGYAHALGKRVILFRKAGTDIHFDLAGYNCPEYRNIRELREKLTKRLEGLTNKVQPGGAN